MKSRDKTGENRTKNERGENEGESKPESQDRKILSEGNKEKMKEAIIALKKVVSDLRTLPRTELDPLL